jgi:hypothetical protein
MPSDTDRLVSGDIYAAPRGADLSDVEVLLHDVALSVAFQITPHNPQYVIKRLLPNSCYKIITGVPCYSERHGIGEVGNLLAPVPKRALLEAIERNEIITVDDAPHDDSVTCYMSSHIQNKGIQSVAIVPIGRGGARWLIVLDKVPPSEQGFSTRDRDHLEACKSSVERSLSHLTEEIVEANNRTLQRALSEYAHLLRNPLTVVGGFARKLKQTRDPERIELYSDIIYSHARRLEEDFCSFVTLVGFLFPGVDRKAAVSLEWFLQEMASDPRYQVLGERDVLTSQVLVVPAALQALLSEMGKYLRASGGSTEIVLVEARKSRTHAALFFHSSAFQEFKEDKDVRLAIFRQVAYQLDGDCRIGKGWCQISVPLTQSRPL